MKKILTVLAVCLAAGLFVTSCAAPGSGNPGSGAGGGTDYLVTEQGLINMEIQICQHWKTERAPTFVNLIFNPDHTGKYWKNEPEWNLPSSYEPPEQYVTKFNWKINRVNGHVELYIGNNKIQDSKYSPGRLEGNPNPDFNFLDYITFEYFDSCENLRYSRVD